MNIAIAESFSSSFNKETKDCNDAPAKNQILQLEELTLHIERSASNNRKSQQIIYTNFFGYAMSICFRYTDNRDDAIEIVNDGFLKIFKSIHSYRPAYTDEKESFKGWLRKIMIYTAIDHFRKNQKQRLTTSIDNELPGGYAGSADPLDKISYEEIIQSVQKLTPGYRTVLNLFIIEGFSHKEIAEQLGISVGASKSNLAKAREQLQKILSEKNRQLFYDRSKQE